MRQGCLKLPLKLVAMTKTGNSQSQWLPTAVVFLCKILYPKQSNDTLTNTVADSFIYIPCGFSESGEFDYLQAVE